MINRWYHPPRLHTPRHGEERKVSWLELFYDLIYVATIIQLGSSLSHNLSVTGALAFAGLFFPIWYTWTSYAFYVNRFVVDDFTHRLLVFVQMFAIGAVAVSIPQVFEGRHAVFALSYAAARLALVGMYCRSWRHEERGRALSHRLAVGFGVGALLWIASAFLPFVWGLLVWVVAMTVDALVPLSRVARQSTAEHPPDILHLSERYGLLTIIVLGESFVKVLTEVAEEGGELGTVLMSGLGLMITSSLWWIYFDDVAGSRIRRGRLSSYVWIYAHLPMAIAVTAVGVAIKKVVFFDPMMAAKYTTSWLLCGSLGLALLSVGVIDAVTERRQAELSDRARVNVRLASAGLVLLLAPMGSLMPAWAFVSLVAAACVVQVIFDMSMAPLSDPHAAEEDGPLLPFLSLDPDESPPRLTLENAVRKGIPSELRNDLYAYFMAGSWWRIFASAVVVYAFINLIFGALYLLDVEGVAGLSGMSYLEAFAFSVQTMSSIGYGAMYPTSSYAHLLVTAEAMIGVLAVALITGLVFAKAARPRSNVLFSDSLVISTRDGYPTLTFRVGNARGAEIVEATMRVSLLMDEVTPEGHQLRRLQDLELVRDSSPIFALSWTVMHRIDASSPLHGLRAETLGASMIAIIATMTGHDSTYAQTTHARMLYRAEDVRFGCRFVDVITTLPDGRMQVDFTRFHDTVPDDAAS